jgi:hypothetical protein
MMNAAEESSNSNSDNNNDNCNCNLCARTVGRSTSGRAAATTTTTTTTAVVHSLVSHNNISLQFGQRLNEMIAPDGNERPARARAGPIGKTIKRPAGSHWPSVGRSVNHQW